MMANKRQTDVCTQSARLFPLKEKHFKKPKMGEGG